MGLLTTPDRLALMLIDAHESIVGAFPYTVDSIDIKERPSWYIAVEEETYPGGTAGQELATQTYDLFYIGETFNSGLSMEFELQARDVANSTILYLLSHPTLQMSNDRNRDEVTPLPPLLGVNMMKVLNRSAITLFQRNAVDDAYWGFTITVEITEQIAYDIVYVQA